MLEFGPFPAIIVALHAKSTHHGGRRKHSLSTEGLFQSPWNFLGLPEELATPKAARGWLLPIPYEGTTSYGAGTREGPAAIIAASRQVELYDREFGNEPAMEYGVHTMNPLDLVHSSPEAMIQAVEEAVPEFFPARRGRRSWGCWAASTRFPPGRARALARSVPKGSLVAVHMDAHADLREEYEGSAYSHACAARRILEVVPGIPDRHPQHLRRRGALLRRCRRVRTVFAEEAAAPRADYLKDLARFVKGKNVFLTVDLDGLDPSIMPAVGTPEPGGISWERMLEIVRVGHGNAAARARLRCRRAGAHPRLPRAGFSGRQTRIQDLLVWLIGKRGPRKKKGEADMGNVKLPKKFVSKYPHKFSKGKQQFLRGKRILPKPITGKESVPELIDKTFLAYNAGRLQEACGCSPRRCSRRTSRSA